MKPNYELAYMKMDKFMNNDSDLDRFYGNKDVNDLADFINSNIVNEGKFYSYAGKGATVEGFAQYLIDNSLNESIEEFYNVANGAESILEDFADIDDFFEDNTGEPEEAEVEIDFEETPGYFSGAFDELDKIYDEENSDQEETNEDEEEIEAIDVLTDKLDAHGDEDTVTIAEKGQLDNPDAPKLEIEVTDEEGKALADEFCDGEKEFDTENIEEGNAETKEDSKEDKEMPADEIERLAQAEEEKSEADPYVHEDLTEAKKDEDELPPDPEAVKLEVHNNLNNLVASEISTIDEYDQAKADILDAPIEHKDELISTIDHIKDEEKEHIDELINATSEIPFSSDTKAFDERKEEINPTDVIPEEEQAEIESGEVEEELTESLEDDKQQVLEMVQMEYESGHLIGGDDFNEFKKVLKDDGITANFKKLYDYYLELHDLGPSGFYQEYKDTLEFDSDFVAEYGDEEDDDDWEDEEEDGLDESLADRLVI